MQLSRIGARAFTHAPIPARHAAALAQVQSVAPQARALHTPSDTSALRLPTLQQLPTTRPALLAMERLGIDRQALRQDAAGFQSQVARLNALAVASPGGLSRHLDPAQDQALALSVALLKAGEQAGDELRSPELASLMFHLLSQVPVAPPVLARQQAFADRLVDETLAPSPLLSRGIDWFDRPSHQRETDLRELFRGMLGLAQSCGLVEGGSIQLALNHDLDLLSASFGRLPASPGRPHDAVGLLSVPAVLTTLDGTQLETAHRGIPLCRPMALSLLWTNLAHELSHASQHEAIDRVLQAPHSNAGLWRRAVLHQVSLGVQGLVFDHGWRHYTPTPTVNLLRFLPHEREAWAMTWQAAQALRAHPKVPAASQQALDHMLQVNADAMAHMSGLPRGPRVTSADGRVWNERGEVCVEITEVLDAPATA